MILRQNSIVFVLQTVLLLVRCGKLTELERFYTHQNAEKFISSFDYPTDDSSRAQRRHRKTKKNLISISRDGTHREKVKTWMEFSKCELKRMWKKNRWTFNWARCRCRLTKVPVGRRSSWNSSALSFRRRGKEPSHHRNLRWMSTLSYIFQCFHPGRCLG